MPPKTILTHKISFKEQFLTFQVFWCIYLKSTNRTFFGRVNIAGKKRSYGHNFGCENIAGKKRSYGHNFGRVNIAGKKEAMAIIFFPFHKQVEIDQMQQKNLLTHKISHKDQF